MSQIGNCCCSTLCCWIAIKLHRPLNNLLEVPKAVYAPATSNMLSRALGVEPMSKVAHCRLRQLLLAVAETFEACVCVCDQPTAMLGGLI